MNVNLNPTTALASVGGAQSGQAGDLLRLVLTVAAVLAVAWVAAMVARCLGQPAVIGEVVGGLLIGPLIVVVAGPEWIDRLLPDQTLDLLRPLGHAGVVLFLVGVAHELRADRIRIDGVGSSRALIGSFAVPLAAGALLAWWLLNWGDPALRGSASTPAFVLMVSVALSVTAVPVLARFLTDRALLTSPVGQLALSVAAVADSGAWLLLAVAIGLNAGGLGGVLTTVLMLAAVVVAALAVRRLLGLDQLARICAWSPLTSAVLLGAGALAAAAAVEAGGLTAVFGAFAVGLAIPRDRTPDGPWTAAVHRVSWVGVRLIPVFFVVSGVTLVNGMPGGVAWLAFVVASLLAMVGKIGGTVLTTVGRFPQPFILRLGVLMNMRGLTEIVLLQAGLAAGLLSEPLVVALTLMAVVTTVLTGPLLTLVDRVLARSYSAAERDWNKALVRPAARRESLVAPGTGA